MRIGKGGFEARVKGSLAFDFRDEQITSYAGLELILRFIKQVGFKGWLRTAERRARFGGDFRLSSFVMLMIAMLVIGARRLRHVKFLRDDPVVQRFAGLEHVPDERTLSRSLKKFGRKSWVVLDELNTKVVGLGVDGARLARVTLDLDGSVITTGLQVGWAFRGYNPHHRKNPSYYPILATLAQTGHVIGHRNRPGNVHDSVGSDSFLREAVDTVRNQLGFGGIIETRTDSAFFVRGFLEACGRYGVEYATKVPMWPWLNLRALILAQGDDSWQTVDRNQNVEGFFAELSIPQWNRTERVAIYRKRSNHRPVKGIQLDLFNPDDGYWEHSVVATNKSLGLRALWHFINGRGAQEKVIGELKSEYAFGCVPTNDYGANTAWQKLNILAHNLVTSFQLATTAEPRPRSLKRTTQYLLRSIRSLRFEWLNKAGRILRPAGIPTLRCASNAAVENAVAAIEGSLPRAA